MKKNFPFDIQRRHIFYWATIEKCENETAAIEQAQKLTESHRNINDPFRVMNTQTGKVAWPEKEKQS